MLYGLRQIRMYVDPQTNCLIPYTPHGRFIHIPPPYPSSDWANDFGRPWWKDDVYCMGVLSQKTRRIKIINTLTSQDTVIEVCLSSPLLNVGFSGKRSSTICTFVLTAISGTFKYSILQYLKSLHVVRHLTPTLISISTLNQIKSRVYV